MSIIYIKAKTENDRWINVEMQNSEDYNFDKRAIYYWAKLVTEQLSEDKMFKELKKHSALISWILTFYQTDLRFITVTK